MRLSTFAAPLAALFVPTLLVTAAPLIYKRASPNDILVMQFAHVLELLETDFYQKALAKFVAKDFTDAGIAVPEVAIQNFQDIFAHEGAHTKFLEAALLAVGAQPVQGCTFNFDSVLTDVATMAAVARVVEAVGVGAYLGGSVLVDDKNVLAAAASILTIEARHQSFLNTLSGGSAVPQAFDVSLTPSEVLALAGPFISGCDLGIAANPPITITNQGAVTIGTKLTFDSPALANAGDKPISCQMMTGDNSTASFPIADCIVPEGINGPVVIFLTTEPQPLPASTISRQNITSVLAGPTIAFIDSKPDALGALVRQGANPVESSDQISQDQAQSEMAQASGSISAPAATASSSATVAPGAEPSSVAASGAESSSVAASGAESSSVAPSGTESSSAAPSGTDSSAPVDATPAQSNSSPVPAQPIKVLGLWSAPAP